MAKLRRKAKRRGPEQNEGPSKFFVIALLIGLVIVAWAVVTAVRQKPAVKTGVLGPSVATPASIW